METAISLEPNLFFGRIIAENILVQSKHKTSSTTQLIDTSGDGFFKKVTNNNELESIPKKVKVEQLVL